MAAFQTNPKKPIEGLTLENITGDCGKGITLVNVNNAVLNGINVTGYAGPLLTTDNVTGAGLEAQSNTPAPISKQVLNPHSPFCTANNKPCRYGKLFRLCRSFFQ